MILRETLYFWKSLMYFCASTGFLVADDQFLEGDLVSKLMSYVPGDDPSRGLRGVVFLRGDNLTIRERLYEFSRWIELFGLARRSGLGLKDIEKMVLDQMGSSAPTPNPEVVSPRKRKFVDFDPFDSFEDRLISDECSLSRNPTGSSPTPPFLEDSTSVKGEDKPTGSKFLHWVGKSFVSQCTKTKGQELKVLSLVNGAKARVQWVGSGRVQDMTCKTLSDRRRYLLKNL